MNDDKVNAGDYLRKGNTMTPEDEQNALSLLLKDGKSKELALEIIEKHKKMEPKEKTQKITEKTRFELQEDIPDKILTIPPPLIVLVIDNATIEEMQEIVGNLPMKLKAQAIDTDEGMKILFKNPKLLKKYPRKWKCKSIYIGGLYVAYNYCANADLVIALQTKKASERDQLVISSFEKYLQDEKPYFIATHLLELDDCKHHDGDKKKAINIFKQLLQKIKLTNYNIVLTTDHPDHDGSHEYMPYFEILK